MTSIIEKVKRFTDLAEGLREPLDENEIEELLKDIEAHAERVYEYMKLVEDDAAKLKEKATEFATAARQQENKAKSIKEYLKMALKANGYTKFKAGDLRMSLSTTNKFVLNREPNEFDMAKNPGWIKSDFKWAREPDFGDLTVVGDAITTDFSWDEKILKKAMQDGNAEAEALFDKIEIDRLTVRVSKEG